MNTPRKILGGILGSFEETDYERETSVASVITSGVGGVIEAAISLVQENVQGKSENKTKETAKFSSGSIDFKNNQAQIEQLQKQQAEQQEEQKDLDRQKTFFQALKEDADRVEKAKDKLLFEEEMDDIVTNLPTDQKNELLHYQASYRDRSIYQRAELRRKIIEQRRQADKQEKAASIPSPAKKPSAIEGAFEGGSGTQGGGTANLSAQAVG